MTGRTRREADCTAKAEGRREERKDGMETETGREGAVGRWRRRRRTHKRLREEEELPNKAVSCGLATL